MTIVQFDIRYLWSLSQQCQRLLAEAMSDDICLWTTLTQTQLIGITDAQSFSASVRLCVVRKTVTPSRATRLARSLRSVAAAIGSKPAVGSSRKINGG